MNEQYKYTFKLAKDAAEAGDWEKFSKLKQ